MTDSISREEFHGFVGMIQKGQEENSKELRELTRNVNLFVIEASKNQEQTRHLSLEVTEVKTELKPMKADISILKQRSSNNSLRWWFLGIVVTSIIGMSTWAYTTFRQPQADVKAAIEENTAINKAILEYIQAD